MQLFGIDVSGHQKDIDWVRVASSDVRFAFIKASEGNTWVDSYFERNWRGCEVNGILHGAYHFARPGTDPEAQAAHFASVVGAPRWDELPPVLDLESTGGLPADALVDWVHEFVTAAEKRFGRPLIIYTGGLWRRDLGNRPDTELGKRVLWTARYGASEPAVPRPWAAWTFWQFTDGTSGAARPVAGVQGPCDGNWFSGTSEELTALATPPLNSPSAPVPPQGPASSVAPPWPGRHLVWPHEPVLRGEDVRLWQTQASKHFAVTVDGAYGPESKRACIALQRHEGLEPDGIVGPSTWAATFA